MFIKAHTAAWTHIIVTVNFISRVTEGDETMYHCESETPYQPPLHTAYHNPPQDDNDFDEMSIPDETDPEY